MDLSNITFPDPPRQCNDPELWTLLAQFEFVRWMRDTNESDYDRIRDWLVQNIDRVLAALDEEEPLFRWRAIFFAVALYREERIDLILKMLNDSDPYVRSHLASHLISISDPDVEIRLLELVMNDPAPEVRASSCRGLAGQNALTVIPVLIHVLDHDHSECESGHLVSDRAANALDEMIGTNFMEKREDGVSTFPENPPNPKAVREHALAYLDKQQQADRN